ncbi:hypothetical protein Lesp02_01640 [Lentzea sp. NBRC 105346]|uniref:ATP-binding protein n=1 Tax=Lentzea sp. NBRC 105346 TaxID=3032205 RepID=UPI0024A003C7|nr:LuxR C-terminal-related transcriptional regulator [Lentzea sp. NBRC 105346]GLZ27974.1 hypothetical protein Lesp02_01640 [Lentzea sp. NBRC 105346]
MSNDHVATLRALVTRVAEAADETERAAALAELQRATAGALRDAVSGARESGVSWRTLSSALRIATATLHDQFASGRQPRSPATQQSHATVLPVQVPDQFVGRRRELAELRRLLPHRKLVTVTGPGGIGKTRLAAEYVQQCAPAFGRVWWVELAALDTGAGVDEAVAAVIGTDPVDVLSDMRGSGRLLLVLDNCEHVVDACGRLVTRLGAAGGELAILATSRERMNTAGEQVLPLASLPRDPALALFADRARGAAPDFQLTGELEVVVADLCRRLDGLPLAIELAARQVAVLPPAELVACLDERLTLLSGGPRTAPERHRSLAATIEWSYDLATETEQAVFRRISVFADGFGRSDAAVVCSDLGLSAAELWTGLTALVAKSLVVADNERLRVLESLRLFGRAESRRRGEWDATASRFADLLAQLSAGIPKPEGMTRPEQRTKRRGHRHNLEYAITLATPADDERYANLVAALVSARRLTLSRNGSRRLIEDALARQRSILGTAILHIELCNELICSGDYDLAREAGGRAVADARKAGNRWLEYRALHALAITLERLRDRDAMTRLLPELLANARAQNEPRLLAATHSLIALEYAQHGRLDEAQDAIDEGLAAIATQSTDTVIMCDLVNTAGSIALQRQDYDRAAAWFSVALSLDDSHGIVVGLKSTAAVAAHRGRPDVALRLFGAAKNAQRDGGDIGSPWWNTLCATALSVARSAFDPATADAFFSEGAKMTLDQTIAYALDDHDSPVLSAREQEVANLVADGLTNRAIAVRLGVSARTVASHLESIRTKLDLRSRAHIAAWVTGARQV